MELRGWHKEDSQTNRRVTVKRNNSGSYLQSARACEALAKATGGNKANADAQYFFAKYRLQKSRNII